MKSVLNRASCQLNERVGLLHTSALLETLGALGILGVLGILEVLGILGVLGVDAPVSCFQSGNPLNKALKKKKKSPAATTYD